MKKLFLIYSLMSLCMTNVPLHVFADETAPSFPDGSSFSTDEETNDQLLNSNIYSSEYDREYIESGTNAYVDEDDPLGDIATTTEELEAKLNESEEIENTDDGLSDKEREQLDKKLTKTIKLSDSDKKKIFNAMYEANMLDRDRDNSEIDMNNFTMSDLVLTVEPQIEHYVWNVWYRETKDEEIDTMENEGRGNYTGFSKEKAAAWNEHQQEIKSINAGAYPEVKDYNYSPGYTLNNKLDFWADKPGYYDVYGDPIYTQVDITASVKVTYSETYMDVEETFKKLNDDAKADSGFNSGGGGPTGGLGGPGGLGEDSEEGKEEKVKTKLSNCTSYFAPSTSGSVAWACNDEDKNKMVTEGYTPTSNYVSAEQWEAIDKDLQKDVFYEWTTESDSDEDSSESLNLSPGTYSEGLANVQSWMGGVSEDYNESKNKANYDDSSVGEEKTVKKSENHPNKLKIIAHISLKNIAGSQLERIGNIGLTRGYAGSGMFYLDDDEFWEEDPYYYYTTGSVLMFEDVAETNTALPFTFEKDADELSVNYKFTDKTIHEKALVHAYNKLQDALTGEDIVIDPSLDINNKDSEYVGKVPLVNFKINDDSASQREQKGTKKNVFLTSESEKDAEDEKKKKREEEENKESYIAQ